MPKNENGQKQFVQYAPQPQVGMVRQQPITIGPAQSPELAAILRNQREKGPGVPIRSTLGGVGHAFSLAQEPWLEKSKLDQENMRQEAMIAQLQDAGFSPEETLAAKYGGKAAWQAIMQGRSAGKAADVAFERAKELERMRAASAANVAGIKAGSKGGDYQPQGNVPKDRKTKEEISGAVQDAGRYLKLEGGFEPEYAGYGMKTGMKSLAESQLSWARTHPEQAKALWGKDVVEAAFWWQQYNRNFVLSERHELFGAALTPTEAENWDRADINPSMTPDQIQRNLAERRRIALDHYKQQMQFYRGTYDKKWLDNIFGFDVADDSQMVAAFNRFMPPPPPGAAETMPSPDTTGATGAPNVRPGAGGPAGGQRMNVQEPPPQSKIEAIPPDAHADYQAQALDAVKGGMSPVKAAKILQGRSVPIPPELEVILGQVTPVDAQVAP